MRFSRIILNNWKNFPAADVCLTNRAFIIGPNASGKSNFLEAFRFLRDIALPGGGLQDETQLSDGTLRLIGLLWSLQESGGPLLLEEPELSLHPSLLPKIPPLIHRAQKASGGRQVLLSTHSEQLLRDEGIGPDEVLIVEPQEEGSGLTEAAKIPEVPRFMLEAGLSASEAIFPRAKYQQMDLLDKIKL